MFQNINGITYVNGQTGIYDGKIKNNSVRYARNAVNNYKEAYSQERMSKYDKKVKETFAELQEINEYINEYMKKSGLNIGTIDQDTFERKIAANKKYAAALKDFSDNMPEAEFSMKYAQNEEGKPDTMAVLGVAYEELGKKTSVSVDELTQTIREGISEQNKSKFSADSLDLNKDGNVDLSEYGASILVEDMLSTNSTELKAKNITGELNNKGQNALLAYAAVNNYQNAAETFKTVQDTFNLKEAQNNFLNDKNNLV